MLTEGEKRQRERGGRLWLVGMNPGVLGVIQRSQLGEALGRDAMHFNLEIAVCQVLGYNARRCSCKLILNDRSILAKQMTLDASRDSSIKRTRPVLPLLIRDKNRMR